MRKGVWAALGLALVLAAGSAQALPIVVDGTIGPVYNATGGWLGGSIDCLTFDVTAGTTVAFDALAYEYDWYTFQYVDLNGDGEFTSPDLMLVLYDESANRLAEADDSFGGFGMADGSVDEFDPYMEYTFATAGTYSLYIGGFYLDDSEIAADCNLGNPQAGDYRITITAANGSIDNLRLNGYGGKDSVVPEPASMALLGMGLSGFALRRLRRRS